MQVSGRPPTPLVQTQSAMQAHVGVPWHSFGMGAQVLSARLAALAEGGDVRLIDQAVSPRRVTFPRPLPTVAICLVAGAIAGLVIALVGVPVTVTPRRVD